MHKGGTVYLRLRKRITITPGTELKLGDVARIVATGQRTRRLSSLPIYKHAPEDGNRYVIDVLYIIQRIRAAEPSLTIEPYGDPQVLVMISDKPSKPKIIVLVFAWLLLFFGSGLAIMNFHADVNMQQVHVRLSELITGKAIQHPLWFQIPYSLGIGFGMMVFFNHLFRKRLNEEPNPLEVELYMYQENVNAYVIADEMRKKQATKDEGDD
ncbi:stage V sporulation protein AA [Paenibacillus daejeonensis]|uniref:stage V sporulation protein AA n=1 Tax=Paenibacillus daejeonensis TaxID=135193 RepID=UPI00059548EF|nr:stage V sporulation protein AA [Paenibacillus daejeonensis]